MGGHLLRKCAQMALATHWPHHARGWKRGESFMQIPPASSSEIRMGMQVTLGTSG